MDKTNEKQELLNPEINLETATVEQLKEFAKKQMEINPQLYARTKKAEADKKASDEALRKAAKQLVGEDTQVKDIISDDARYESIELMAKGYNDDEVAFIMKNGGKKSLENPFVKSAVEGIRTQRKAEQAAQIESGSKSDISKKYTDEQISRMSSKELQKILES